jgi:hypothetical protein
MPDFSTIKHCANLQHCPRAALSGREFCGFHMPSAFMTPAEKRKKEARAAKIAARLSKEEGR